MRSRVVVGVGGGAPSDCSIIPELCPLYILFYTQEVPVPSSSLSSWSVDQISLKYGKVLLKHEESDTEFISNYKPFNTDPNLAQHSCLETGSSLAMCSNQCPENP